MPAPNPELLTEAQRKALYGIIKVYDNGDKSMDRYTAVYLSLPTRERDMYEAVGMNEAPFHPGGFGQHTVAAVGDHLGKCIQFDDLPRDCQRMILQDLWTLLPPAEEQLGCERCDRTFVGKRSDSQLCPACALDEALNAAAPLMRDALQYLLGPETALCPAHSHSLQASQCNRGFNGYCAVEAGRSLLKQLEGV